MVIKRTFVFSFFFSFFISVFGQHPSTILTKRNLPATAETTVGYKGKGQSLKLITDTHEMSSLQFSIGDKMYTITINYNNKQTFISIK